MGFFSHEAEDDVIVSATFPDSNPFGLVVNGERNPLSLHLSNIGKKNYTLVSAAASYHDTANNWALMKNVSTLKYNVPLVSKANFSAPFTMHSEFRPREIGLTVWVNLAETGTNDIHRITALNQTVSIVEPQQSWFDLRLVFLYLIMGTALLGGAYAAYNAFLGPKKTRRGTTRTVKKAVVVPSETKPYPEVKPYEEEWIPAHHLKSKGSKTKKGVVGGDEVLSAGEATSGGETSGAEGKRRKSKGKK